MVASGVDPAGGVHDVHIEDYTSVLLREKRQCFVCAPHKGNPPFHASEGFDAVGVRRKGLLSVGLGMQLKDKSKVGGASSVAKSDSEEEGQCSHAPKACNDYEGKAGGDVVERHLEWIFLA